MDMLNAAKELRDLQSPPGNRLEKLGSSSAGFHSIRINDRFRIIFRWVAGNARNVRITDYHRELSPDPEEAKANAPRQDPPRGVPAPHEDDAG
jgi:toxin HigB-1